MSIQSSINQMISLAGAAAALKGKLDKQKTESTKDNSSKEPAKDAETKDKAVTEQTNRQELIRESRETTEVLGHNKPYGVKEIITTRTPAQTTVTKTTEREPMFPELQKKGGKR